MARFYQYSPSPNYGEHIVENYLKKLPDSTAVFAEYKINDKDYSSDKERKPDFVILSPLYGLVCLEVKMWNIFDNSYKWENQYTLIKENISNGSQVRLQNPFSQASDYLYLLKSLCKRIKAEKVYVSSFVVFPTIERSAFYNRFSDLGFFDNPQGKFHFDINKVIFKDELEQNITSLNKYLYEKCKQNDHFREAQKEDIEKLETTLLLPEFSIGGLTKQTQSHRESIKKLTSKQSRWAFGIDDQNALILDIAGSGKTSALISRAIHLSNKYPDRKMLITTYNDKLIDNIKFLYETRLNNENLKKPPYFTINSIHDLAKNILKDFYNEMPSLSGDDIIDAATDVVEENLLRYQIFDHVFVDEVQDFSTMDLNFLSLLCRSNHGFFFAGDIAQKVRSSVFNLQSINIKAQDIALPKEYKMYRTPQKIAELALKFTTKNKQLRQEFLNYGYLTDGVVQGKEYKVVTEFHPSDKLSDLIQQSLAKGYAHGDILVITTKNKKATIQGTVPNTITVLDYIEVKGFEAPCIILDDIENIIPTPNIFENPEDTDEKEILMRRLVYIALTRTTEVAYIMVNDPKNSYIKELYSINQLLIEEK